jgi:hypothetical protein
MRHLSIMLLCSTTTCFKRSFAPWAFLLLIAFLLAVMLPQRTHAAATLCVNPSGGMGCYTTIQSAIDAATSGDTITIAAGVYAEFIQINFNKPNLTLLGAGANATYLDGAHAHPVLAVTGDATIRGVTIRNGQSGNGAGVMLNSATLHLSACVITHNQATSAGGGGIDNYAGSLNIDTCTISDNQAPNYDGGGINNSGALFVTNSIISGNSAKAGGGIDSVGNLTLANSQVTGNTVTDSGGGILFAGTKTADLTSDQIANNTAANKGGGLYIAGGTVGIYSSTIHANTVTNVQNGAGGGIDSNGALTVSQSQMSSNSAPNGAGLTNEQFGTATVTQSRVSQNVSQLSGGGIANLGSLMLDSSTVDTNTVGPVIVAGGGIYNIGKLTMLNSTISGNQGGTFGALYNHVVGGYPAQVTITSATITNNSGGIQNEPNGGTHGSVLLRNTILSGNGESGTPADCGGPLVSQGYNLLALDCTVSGDTTGNIAGQDPHVGPLSDNGGLTPTHALLAGSPAMDAGPTTAGDGALLATDQRGVQRPQGTRADIGAYEANALPLLINVQPLLIRASSTETHTLSIQGRGFIVGARVQWNGADRSTTYVSEHELTVRLEPNDTAKAGQANVRVRNPGPGDGSTADVVITIQALVFLPMMTH